MATEHEHSLSQHIHITLQGWLALTGQGLKTPNSSPPANNYIQTGFPEMAGSEGEKGGNETIRCHNIRLIICSQ